MELRLRAYKPKDAEQITKWITTKEEYLKWSAGLFGCYPLDAKQMNAYYEIRKKKPYEWPMTAYDEEGIVGHFLMHFSDRKHHSMRLGFVIIDDKKRGCGYGKEMLRLAIRYAYDQLDATEVTLGVFENNKQAYYCYRAVGFEESKNLGESIYHIQGQDWKCLELKTSRKDSVRYV